MLAQPIYLQDYTKTIDSLKIVNSSSGITKNKKAKTLYNLAWYYYTSQLYDSSIVYSRQAFYYATNNSIDTVIHKSTVMLGGVFTTQYQYDSAAFYLSKGVAYFEKLNNKIYQKELAKIYSVLANVLAEQNKYQEAYQYYDKSEQTYATIGDTMGLIFNKLSKGNLFTNLQLFDKALVEYNDAARLSKYNGFTSNLAYVYNNISTVYKKIGDTEIAKDYLFKAITECKKKQVHNLLGDVYHNLSLLYNSINNNDSAIYYNTLALKEFKALQLSYRENTAKLWRVDFYLAKEQFAEAKNYLDSIGEIEKVLYAKYYLLYSKLAYEKKDYNASVNYANKALLVAQQNKDITEQTNCHEMLYKAYTDKPNLVEAMKAYENYNLLKDSIFNQEKSIAVQKVILENSIEEKNAEIKLAALKHQKAQAEKNKVIWVTLLIIVGLMLVLFIIYLMFKNQKQKAKISQTELELVTKEAKEVKTELELEVLKKEAEKVKQQLEIELIKKKSEETKKELEVQLLKKEADKVKQELEIELLKKEAEEIKKEIVDFSLQSLKNKEFIELTRSKLKTIKQKTFDNEPINSLYAITNQFLLNEKDRDEFQQRVEAIQKSFFEKLDQIIVSDGGKLTKTEKKLAALLKMQLSSKEIGSILNVEETSVEIYRSRLRKKLNIDSSISLIDYFNSI